MKSINENNIIDTFVKTFPAFAEENPFEEYGGPYDYIGDFAVVISEEIEKGGKDKSKIDRSFEFFNKMAEEGDDEVQNILIVEVLEQLADDGIRTKVAREKLKGKALEYFERVLRGWDKG